ncbi:MAG: 50S ribosomal protein L24 [Deltaproteobacteria bacterium]|jgi:large subunit ribosomal protein L24|nr:50S ribosomal protein L24 [Deltaproteobacteria bacterium]MBT6432132.1 50S ribosomal protein L24 [Deltaproteobacteria bacterium]MBT6488653.1 50S ribosomal protein L24 [Deltaproteobacteria bacterium]
MARHVRTGDTVEVISGKYRGKQGKILEFLADKNRVVLEGVGVVKRHLKPNMDPKVPQGGIIEKDVSIHVSNVLPLDPKTNKPTRVGFNVLDNGKKVRISRATGEQISEV